MVAGLTASCSRCVSSSLNLSALSAALPSTSYGLSHLQTLSQIQHLQRSSFSSSSMLSESRKKRTARLKRKSNLDQRILKVRMLESSKPDAVLGHQTNAAGTKVWEQSELVQIILNKQTVWGVQEDRRGNLVSVSAAEQAAAAKNAFDVTAAKEAAASGGPLRLNFGLDGDDRQLLFHDLPHVMLKDRILDSWTLGTLIRGTANHADIAAFDAEYAQVQSEEQTNKQSLARILDLRNASGKGIQVENIRRIIAHFGGPANDTGSPEVQAAVLTYRIRNLHDHLQSNRHDNSNRRSMSLLTHQRAKILKYLKKKSPQRYHTILPRIGVEARAVEGEIVVPGKPKIARA
ncbi:related to MRPS28-mitochondrial ribosomal protein, small subunit [Sporisorium reilianum f. sp. reilianum]|uniref:Related to MRPS28-mitochondrial ribosomal protein, small subunit n=1 Tax=Sporisorium reilianum f. sp. reilianum TaxID=72559 RepID=A0A2N8UHE2_9BASI|nr:related to MRPS28-mitochondrial ribosomal protein, small subunit [Sporisorium reilianum f. sp. reilianum]